MVNTTDYAGRPAPLVLNGVVKRYGRSRAGRADVLDGLDLTVSDGEIVAVLGQSGCGKSTLLRIVAGLVPASGGEVLYRGSPVSRPNPGVAMVFQSFALFPWLTVQENVAFGLEAQGIPRLQRIEKAVRAIELIGLDGYENAYPKELSGGMRQRVGFARALVVDPDVLLLDEPFSALDVLTAETLRDDLMDLWHERRIPTRAIVFVSHNIQEAVEVSDRIVVLSSHPGRVRADIRVELPFPRDPEGASFKAVVDRIYRELAVGIVRAHGGALRPDQQIPLAHRLPPAGPQPMLGLIDALANPPYDGEGDLAELEESEEQETDQLLHLVEGLQLLGYVTVDGTTVRLAPLARSFLDADIQERKRQFGMQLKRHVPLIRHVLNVLGERTDHEAPESRFIAELEDHLSKEEAEAVLATAINWARYAELFAYDYDSGALSLPKPEAEKA